MCPHDKRSPLRALFESFLSINKLQIISKWLDLLFLFLVFFSV